MNKWLKKQKFVIFGAGDLGGELVRILDRYNSFCCFIDNNKNKQTANLTNEQSINHPVVSFDFFLGNYKEHKIILACVPKNRKTIEQQMTNAGLKNGEDFIFISDFTGKILPLYALNHFKENYISTVQICVTERCTLKCKKCAHGCYAVSKNSDDMPLSLVKESADYFFSHIDYLYQFYLIGGEPFLYKDLPASIEYIGEKYRERMNNFCITTNGTIIPQKNVLEVIKKYNMLIQISNYSHTLPQLKHQYEKLTQTFDSFKINYRISQPDTLWTDYGFDYMDRGFFDKNANKTEKSQELKKIFAACQTPCREIRGSKLYFCVQARTCNDNLEFNVGKEDYLDLSKLGNDNESKKILTDFEMGIFPKGYLDMCNYCNGAERLNYPIPAAEQKGD